jgi:hypothetical protein
MALYTISNVLCPFFREEKLKLKKARNEQTKQEESAAEEEFDSEDDTEESNLDLSWLPDPDKVFPSRDKGAEDSDRSELTHTGRGRDDSDDDDDDDSCGEEEEEQSHK